MHVRVIDGLSDLKDIVPQWQELLSGVTEQNINYEPTPLLSVLSELDYAGWFVVTVWEDAELCGFFPMESAKRLPLPIKQFASLFKNHFMSAIPLVEQKRQQPTLDAFWTWINSDSAKIFYVSELLPNSTLGQAWLNAASQSDCVVKASLSTDRAVASVSSTGFDQYLQQAISGKGRNTLKRKQRKLEAIGQWHHTIIDCDHPELANALNQLIDVEAKSWKADAGSAIKLNPPVGRYMSDMAFHAASQKRLVLAVASVDDEPIAAMYSLINDGKLLIYKIGFDERFSQYSVGQRLMLELIRYCIEREDITSVDSCAKPDAEMFNRCLPERQTVMEYQVASGHLTSRLAVLAVEKSRRFRLLLRR